MEANAANRTSSHPRAPANHKAPMAAPKIARRSRLYCRYGFTRSAYAPTLVTPAPQRTYHEGVIRTIPALFAIGLAIYALVDCVRAEERLIKALPRTAWMLLIAFVPLIGPIAWLVTGRVREGGQPRRAATPPRPIAPEDDPDFMRSLEDQRRRERKRRERESGEADGRDDGENPPAQAV